MTTMTVTIADDEARLDPSELAEFLYLFRAVNVALSGIVLDSERQQVREPSIEEIARYRTRLGKCTPQELNSFFDPETEPGLLEIEQIKRESPTELALVGCAFLLVLGVIFSGGSISVSVRDVRATLPPFGKGVKFLREALGLDHTLEARFGIRSKVIRLNAQEYEALMLQNPASKESRWFSAFSCRPSTSCKQTDEAA
jgi:hypothetical protein